MNKKVMTSGAAALLFASISTQALNAGVTSAPSAPVDDSNPFTLSVALNSDSFFGFYPTFNGAYNLGNNWAFTAYGIFWNAGNSGGAWGEWTEFGIGVAYNPTPWLSINPAIGFLSGSLLSAGALTDVGVLGDGYVPSLTVNLNHERWEGQLYSGFYLPMRDRSNQLEFLHYWANFGYKVTKFVSAGVHYEALMGGSNLTSNTVYSWVGPYIQFRNENKGLFVRFSGGWETEGTNGSDTFWKMAAGFTF